MSTCRKWWDVDEMACTCGLRWDVSDEDPHSYAAESKAQALVAEEHQGGRDVARHQISKIRKDLKQCKKI